MADYIDIPGSFGAAFLELDTDTVIGHYSSPFTNATFTGIPNTSYRAAEFFTGFHSTDGAGNNLSVNAAGGFYGQLKDFDGNTSPGIQIGAVFYNHTFCGGLHGNADARIVNAQVPLSGSVVYEFRFNHDNTTPAKHFKIYTADDVPFEPDFVGKLFPVLRLHLFNTATILVDFIGVAVLSIAPGGIQGGSGPPPPPGGRKDTGENVWNLQHKWGHYHKAVVTAGNIFYYRSDTAIPLPDWQVNAAAVTTEGDNDDPRMVVDHRGRIILLYHHQQTTESGADITLNSWQDTGVVLQPKEVLTVSADGYGKWDPTYYAYPEGSYYPDVGTPPHAEDLPSVFTDFSIGNPANPWVCLNTVPFSLVLLIRPDGTTPEPYGVTDGLRPNRGPSTFVAPDGGRVWAVFNDRYTAYADNTGSFALAIEQSGSVYEVYSDDEGQTWSSPIVAIPGGKHPTIAIHPDGTIIRAAFIPGGAEGDPGTIQANVQHAGDAEPSDLFTFQAWDEAAGSLHDMSVPDDTFHLQAGFEGPNRWVLAIANATSEAFTDWTSADDGATWKGIS